MLVDDEEAAGQPVVGVVVDGERSGHSQGHTADFVQTERVGSIVLECDDVEPVVHACHDRLHDLRRVLDQHPIAGVEPTIRQLADRRVELADNARFLTGVHDEIAAPDVDVVGQAHYDGLRRMRKRHLAVERVDSDDGRAHPRRHDHDDVLDLDDTGRKLPCVAAIVRRSDDVLNRQPSGLDPRVESDWHRLKVLEQGRACVPRHRGRTLDDVVAQVRRHRDHHVVADSECFSRGSEFLCNSKESSLVKVDEIHLVHCKDKMPDVE